LERPYQSIPKILHVIFTDSRPRPRDRCNQAVGLLQKGVDAWSKWQNTDMISVNWAKADLTQTFPMTVNPMQLAAFKDS